MSITRITTASLCLVFILLGTACKQQSHKLQSGPYRAVVIPDTTRKHLELPFNFELNQNEKGAWMAEIRNGNERIQVSEIAETTDSVIFNLPVFKGQIRASKKHNGLVGIYTHQAAGKSWSIPFEAEAGSRERFVNTTEPSQFNVSGRWKVMVNPDQPKPEIQVGEFIQDRQQLTGTFLTVLGDYRFLEGAVSGDRFMLSCFDGAHSLLFTARLAEGQLVEGIFCGGPTWMGTWTATRNDSVSLPDASSLTYLKPGYDKIDFAFPDMNQDTISLADPKFDDKVVVLQIIGSWCPNCMDETRYFAELYQSYRAQGLEIVALCYESEDFEASREAIQRFKKDIGAEYTFLHAGQANKQKASATLPMLNRIISYPTSIFIDRNQEIRHIFTGFSGPGTGQKFNELCNEMEALIEQLLSEQ